MFSFLGLGKERFCGTSYLLYILADFNKKYLGNKTSRRTFSMYDDQSVRAYIPEIVMVSDIPSGLFPSDLNRLVVVVSKVL